MMIGKTHMERDVLLPMRYDWHDFKNEMNSILLEYDMSCRDFVRTVIEGILEYRWNDYYNCVCDLDEGKARECHYRRGIGYGYTLFILLNNLGKGLKEILILGRLKGVL